MSSMSSMSMSMSIEIVNEMKKVSAELSKKVIRELGVMYNFDSEEAIKRMNLDMLNVELVSKVKSEKVKKVKSEKVKKIKSKYPLPFNNKKNESCCSALRQNHGLYTQCENLKNVSGIEYCKKCLKESLKNDSGIPDYGTIDDRIKVGLYEFRDPKGKSPIAYTKLMSKLKFTREEVEEEAKLLNYELVNEHFEYVEEQKRGRPKVEKVKDTNGQSSGKKGRPKKMNKEVEITSDVGEDIFASLIENANVNVNANVNNVVSEVVTEVVNSEKSEKEAEKDAKKAEKDAKKAEKDAKKAEKDAKKAEKEAKKLEKDAKNAEKDAKKAEKEAKKVEKETKKVEKVEPKQVVDDDVDVVRKFEYEGTTYLKSKSTGVIYNMEQDLVGKWNEATQKIDFEVIDEEEEDEYDDE
jgi:hypothetical protein